MSAYFIDLDGTLVAHGTNDLLPGAKRLLQFIHAEGHQVIVTTRRGIEFEGHPVYAEQPTEAFLRQLEQELEIKFTHILYGVPSPRIIINDDGCESIKTETNEGCAGILADMGIDDCE